MAKARFMLASSVVLDDQFLSMSPEAQALNTVLNAEADVTGRIVGIQRIVRGCGYAGDPLQELVRNGYVLQTSDGSYYVAHVWVHNKFDKRLWERMEDCEPYRTGELFFTGEEGRSSYAIDASSTHHRRSNDDGTTCNSNAMATGNGNPTATPNENGPGEKNPPCPKCGATLRRVDEQSFGCDACHELFDV